MAYVAVHNTMDAETYKFHIESGRRAGKDRTCGKKVDWKSEERATQTAEKMSLKYDRDMEAYPCAFCNGWHIGGKFDRGGRGVMEA